MATQQGEQNESVKSGEEITVAYLGPVASYTHQAARNLFSNDISTTKHSTSHRDANSNEDQHTPSSNPTTQSDSSIPVLRPCNTISDVFTAVRSQTANFGVVPLENSSNGAVMATLDLLAEELHRSLSEGDAVRVAAETFVPVRHCLLGNLPEQSNNDELAKTAANSSDSVVRESKTSPTSLSAKDHTSASTSESAQDNSRQIQPTQRSSTDSWPSLSRIKTIHTHPQAWGQCKNLLTNHPHLSTIPHIDASSTSAAAVLAASDKSGATAAIASPLAAEAYDVKILIEGCQDRDDNVTRFLLLERQNPNSSTVSESTSNLPTQYPSESGKGNEITVETSENPESSTSETTTYKSLIALTVPHTTPGALAQALSAFQPQKLNLTSINTRPSGQGAWHYTFLVEVEWREDGDGDGDGDGDEESGKHDKTRKLQKALTQLEKIALSQRCLGIWESAAGTAA